MSEVAKKRCSPGGEEATAVQLGRVRSTRSARCSRSVPAGQAVDIQQAARDASWLYALLIDVPMVKCHPPCGNRKIFSSPGRLVLAEDDAIRLCDVSLRRRSDGSSGCELVGSFGCLLPILGPRSGKPGAILRLTSGRPAARSRCSAAASAMQTCPICGISFAWCSRGAMMSSEN